MSSNQEYPKFKIVLVGNATVGKTSLLRQLISHEFFEDTQLTAGVEFRHYSMKVNDEEIQLNIWDTAGQERYRSVAKSYVRSSFGALLVFDLTDRSSFEAIGDWLEILNSLAEPNAFFLLIGNKSDLTDQRQVGSGEAAEYAKRNNIEYIETSAKTGRYVSDAFVRMGQELYRRMKSGTIQVPGQEKKNIDISQPSQQPQSSGCSC